MTPESLKSRRLVGLFLLGWVLYSYPILSLFNLPAVLRGIPLLYIYIFAAWAGIIGLLVGVTRLTRRG